MSSHLKNLREQAQKELSKATKVTTDLSKTRQETKPVATTVMKQANQTIRAGAVAVNSAVNTPAPANLTLNDAVQQMTQISNLITKQNNLITKEVDQIAEHQAHVITALQQDIEARFEYNATLIAALSSQVNTLNTNVQQLLLAVAPKKNTASNVVRSIFNRKSTNNSNTTNTNDASGATAILIVENNDLNNTENSTVDDSNTPVPTPANVPQ